MGTFRLCGRSNTWTFCPCFGMKTLRLRDFLVQGHYDTKTFRHRDIPVLGQFQHMYVSAQTFWHLCRNVLLCGNVHFAQMFQCRNVRCRNEPKPFLQLSVPCSWLSGLAEFVLIFLISEIILTHRQTLLVLIHLISHSNHIYPYISNANHLQPKKIARSMYLRGCTL